MGLGLGSRFGRYRLDAVLGRGGMGVVFRALDVELDRPVALKVLARDVADDPAFRERFVREARLLAAMDHPSVVPIYEAGEVDGLLFLAMRYVPGRDLGDVLRLEAPLDPARTLRLLAQVAGALDAAHLVGLVHRDVKAANILVAGDPRGAEHAFLADFGLTKRLGTGVGPTLAGQLVGSVGAVAPEQIEGRAIDGRADQYSLACLLYECLTGDPPFHGEHDLAVLHQHLHAPPPDLAAVRPDLPKRLGAVLARGLAKRADDRYATCAELIEAASRELGLSAMRDLRPGTTGSRPGRRSGGLEAPARTRRGSHRAAIAVVSVLVLGAAGAAAVILAAGDRPPADVPAPLPPGGRIVFVAGIGPESELYSIRPDGSDLLRLTDNEWSDTSPALSPDGASLAYASAEQGNRDIHVMRPDGSRPARLTLSTQDDDHPAWSWDGRALAFTRGGAGSDLFLIEDALSTDSLTSRSQRITTGPATDDWATWSPDGPSLAMSSDRAGRSHIWRLEPGTEDWRAITTGPTADTTPAWSPDGRWIAFVRLTEDGEAGLFRVRPDGGDLTRLAREASHELAPAWSPDGRFLVYARGRAGRDELVLVDASSGEARTLATGVADVSDPYWGPA